MSAGQGAGAPPTVGRGRERVSESRRQPRRCSLTVRELRLPSLPGSGRGPSLGAFIPSVLGVIFALVGGVLAVAILKGKS